MAIDLNAMRVKSVEQWRILWTTFKHLDMWFDNWIEELVHLRFVVRMDENVPHEVYISNANMGRILNFY